MKIVSLAALVFGVLLANGAMAQSCQPSAFILGAASGITLLGNPGLTNGTCWTSNASLVSASDCGTSSHTYQMTYGKTVSQTQTVPADSPTDWELHYELTMQDPNDDGWWNRLRVRVIDQTTNQVLATETYWGDDPDVTCQQRTLTFSGDKSGHQLRVVFDGGSSYPNTFIRFDNVHLLAVD